MMYLCSQIQLLKIRVNWHPSKEFEHLRQQATFQPNINRRDEHKLLMATKRGDSAVQLGHSKKQASSTEADSY